MLQVDLKKNHAPPSFARQSLVFAASGIVLILISVADQFSNAHIHLGPLYLLPVILAAWFGGRWPGYLIGAGCIASWLGIIEPTLDQGIGWPILAWNLAVRIFYYTIIVELLLMLRNIGRRLEKIVEERTAELRAQITERERAEASLRKLAGQLSEAEDIERRRIAYDIHDALSQMLGVVKLNLEFAVAESPIDTRQFERLTDTINVVKDLIRQTRELTFDLHPSMLDDLGLGPTIEEFAGEFHRRTQAEVTVSELGERKPVPSSLASYLFRAVKELVNNSVKHGNAHEIIITIHWIEQGLRIVVDDDGKGFDPASALQPNTRRGLGLAGIDERLTSLGGMLRLESQSGQGACAIVEVPFSTPSPASSGTLEAAKIPPTDL